MNNKLLAIVLFITAFIFYGNTIPNKFALDDSIVLTDNSFTQKGLGGLKDIFTHDSFAGISRETSTLSGGRYRPLSIASFAIEKAAFGNKPLVFHFFNVLFYALTSVLIFMLLLRLLSSGISKSPLSITLPFVAALLFVILPIHSEVVANIKSRDEIFSLLFSTASFIFMLPSRTYHANEVAPENNFPFVRTTISIIFLFLALLSKESAVSFVVIIPAGLILLTTGSRKYILVKSLLLLIPVGIYFFMRLKFAGVTGGRLSPDVMNDPFINATTIQRLATITYVQLRYLLLILFPFTLSSDYSFNQIPVTTFGDAFVILSILIHLGLIMLAIININKNKLITFSLLFYLAAFIPASNLFIDVGTAMAERFAYIPSLGISLMAAVYFLKLFKMGVSERPVLKTIPVIILSILFIAAIIKTSARNKDWLNNYTLFKADAVNAPNSARTHLYYGIESFKESQRKNNPFMVEEAIKEIRISLKIYPGYKNAWNNLASVYYKTGKFDEAIKCYEQTLRLDSTNVSALYAIAYSYGKNLNQPQKAITYFEKLLADTNATKPEFFEGIGICYSMIGDYRRAVDYYLEGIALNPNAGKLYYNAAIDYDKMGMADSSEIYMDMSEELSTHAGREQ